MFMAEHSPYFISNINNIYIKMKRLFLSLLAFSAIAIFAVSCASDSDTEPRPDNIKDNFVSTAKLTGPVLGVTEIDVPIEITKDDFPEYKAQKPYIVGWLDRIEYYTDRVPNNMRFVGLPEGVGFKNLVFYINKDKGRNEGMYPCKDIKGNSEIVMEQKDEFYKKIFSLLSTRESVKIDLIMTNTSSIGITKGDLTMEISGRFYTKESR